MPALGRAPHDPDEVARAPSLAAHRFAAKAPPPFVNRADIPFWPQLDQNDVLPDCTAVGLRNALGMTAEVNGFELAVDETKIPLFYAACVGVEPTVAAMAATEGAVALDVLVRQAVHGFDIGQQVPYVGKFGTLPKQRSVIAGAIHTFGHAYLGVTLHERDMEGGAVWDVQDGRDDGEIIGGHLIVGWDYTGLTGTDTVRVATWGAWQPATWNWLMDRLDEQYALVWRQLAGPGGIDVGIDYGALEAALAVFMS
jgi:hypothetical protein